MPGGLTGTGSPLHGAADGTAVYFETETVFWQGGHVGMGR